MSAEIKDHIAFVITVCFAIGGFSVLLEVWFRMQGI